MCEQQSKHGTIEGESKSEESTKECKWINIWMHENSVCVRACIYILWALVVFNLFPFTLINCCLSRPNPATKIFTNTIIYLCEWLNGIYKSDFLFICFSLYRCYELLSLPWISSGTDQTVPFKLELPIFLFPFVLVSLTSMIKFAIVILYTESQMLLYDLIIDIICAHIPYYASYFLVYLKAWHKRVHILQIVMFMRRIIFIVCLMKQTNTWVLDFSLLLAIWFHWIIRYIVLIEFVIFCSVS